MTFSNLLAARRSAPPPGRRRRSRLRARLSALLALPIVLSAFTLAPPQGASADELSDAIAQQRALERQISDQKAKIAELAGMQQSLSGKIAKTKTDLAGVNADLAAVKSQVAEMETQIAAVQARYDDLVDQLASLTNQLYQVRAEEALKAQQLDARKAQLAERIRSTYDLDRTSLLEIVLSSDSFTDLLSETGYYMDVAQQDRDLALKIQEDQRTLAQLRTTVTWTRDATEQMRVTTAAQKDDLDAQLADLNAAREELNALEAKTRALLKQQNAAYAALNQTKAAAQKSLADDAAAEKALQKKIDELVAAQSRGGAIPSVYNGTLDWPMAGTITQEYGCTGFSWEPPLGSCSHFHKGIDIAAPMYTPIRAAGPGVVVFAGANPYDPYPKAWIVIIAHSSGLRTWYAHIDNYTHPPRVRAGDVVRTGQIIAYEGMTGRTTGPHLHWAVELEGEFVNPRLFL